MTKYIAFKCPKCEHKAVFGLLGCIPHNPDTLDFSKWKHEDLASLAKGLQKIFKFGVIDREIPNYKLSDDMTKIVEIDGMKVEDDGE